MLFGVSYSVLTLTQGVYDFLYTVTCRVSRPTQFKNTSYQLRYVWPRDSLNTEVEQEKRRQEEEFIQTLNTILVEYKQELERVLIEGCQPIQTLDKKRKSERKIQELEQNNYFIRGTVPIVIQLKETIQNHFLQRHLRRRKFLFLGVNFDYNLEFWIGIWNWNFLITVFWEPGLNITQKIWNENNR